SFRTISENTQRIHTREKRITASVTVGRVLAQQSSLQRHHACFTQERKPYYCSDCGVGVSFLDQSQSQDDTQRINTRQRNREKPRKEAPQVPASGPTLLRVREEFYSAEFSPKKHQLIHTGEKPYRLRFRVV
ncbi:hypothetical protein NFI96_032206, partial [Prochilodus magdalenae]